MNASREAYDLHHPPCRTNTWRRLKLGDWKSLGFLRLIWTDTRRRVCSARPARLARIEFTNTPGYYVKPHWTISAEIHWYDGTRRHLEFSGMLIRRRIALTFIFPR